MVQSAASRVSGHHCWILPISVCTCRRPFIDRVHRMDSVFLSLPGATNFKTALKKRCACWCLFRSVSVDDLVLFLHAPHCGVVLCCFPDRLDLTGQRALGFVEAWRCCDRCFSNSHPAVFNSVLPRNARRGG